VARKQDLVAAAERIDPTGDIEAARAQLRNIQERWEAIGKVPRERVRELEGRLRAVEERIRTAANAQWRHSDPESEARVAQFRERVELYEAQAAKARAAGDDRRADTAQAQANQWREWLAAAERAVTSR
jgi:DNA repair exonuclease SbcCD ATPase subunit